MSVGRLTIWIDGREALPLRAIPYVAGWEHLYSPDVVAESLARVTAAPFEKLRNLVAYHRPASKPLPVMAGEWTAAVAEIKGFVAGLREQRPDTEAMDDHAGYAAWRKGAALKLPAGVFVWLDEFLREREADRKRTPDDRPVTLAPMLDDDTRAALLEGFEDCPRRGPDAGMAGGIDEETVDAMFGEREHRTGWYDATLDADMWFGLASPTPREAAMVLCQFNPHDDNCDPTTITTDETGPEDFKRLLRVFEDLEKVEPKARTLRQWLAIAREKGLKYHSWIDAYALARTEELPADSGSGDGAVKGGAGGTAAVSTLPAGIPTGTIIEWFRLTDAWADKLKHICRNPFLRAALMREGCRKSGKTPATPHLWNPVRFAEILIERDGKNRRAMEAIITHNFSASFEFRVGNGA